MIAGFSPIVRTSPQMTPFNDERLWRRYRFLKEAMIRKRSSTINQLASSDKERRAYYRFMSNEKVTISELMGVSGGKDCADYSGKHILAIGDTSEISLKQQLSHIKDAARVGLLSDHKTRGFLVHAQMLLDAQSGHGLCLSSLLLWNRPQKGNKSTVTKPPYEERESYKWERGIQDSELLTSSAQMVTYVFDQEADIFDLYSGIKTMGGNRHLIVRCHYNRKVETTEGPMSVWDFMEPLPFSIAIV